MKIIITESQLDVFKRLIENDVLLNNGNTKEYKDSSVETSATIKNGDGDPKDGKPVSADEFSKQQTCQNIWLGSIRSVRG